MSLVEVVAVHLFLFFIALSKETNFVDCDCVKEM